MDIDIKGLDKAKLLVRLYENTRPQGMGWLHAHSGGMSVAEAHDLLLPRWDGTFWFDYVKGRPIKVGFSEDTMHRADLYDRDAPDGDGTAQRIVDELRRAVETEGA